MELKTYDEFFRLFPQREYGKTNDENTSFAVSDKVADRGYANGKYDWNCFDSFNNVKLESKDKEQKQNIKVTLTCKDKIYVIQPFLSVCSFRSITLFIFSIFIILLTIYLLYKIYFNYPNFSEFCKLLNIPLRNQQSIIRILFFGMLMSVFLLLLIVIQYNVLASKINDATITSTQTKALIIALFLIVCWIIIILNSKNAVRFITNHKTSLYYLITASAFLSAVLLFVLFKNYSLTFLLMCCISVIVFCIHVLPLFFSPIMFSLIPSWFTFASKISDKTNTTDSEEENEKSIKEFISNIFFLCIFGLWWVIPLWSGIFLIKFFDPDDSYNVYKENGGDLSINMYGGVFSSPAANKFLKIQPIIGFFTSWFQPIPNNNPELFKASELRSGYPTAPTSKFQINVDKTIFKTNNMGNDMWTTIKWGFLKEMPLVICCLYYMTKMANFCNLCRDTKIKFENMEQQKVEFQKKILSLNVSNNVKSIIFYSLHDHDPNEILFFNQKFPPIQKILEEKQIGDMKTFQDWWKDYYAKNYIHFINLINFYYTVFTFIVLLTLCLLMVWIFNTCYFIFAVFQNVWIVVVWFILCLLTLSPVASLFTKWFGEKIF